MRPKSRQRKPWRGNQGTGRPGLIRGHWDGNSALFPNQTLLAWKRECSSSGLGQWMSGRLWDVREGASCLCWGTLLHAVEPRQVTFLAGVSEFIVRAKAPPFPTLGLLPKRLCVPGTICTKVPHGDANPSRGPGMEP